MKTLVGGLVVGLTMASTAAFADVTPAAQSLHVVKKFLEAEIEQQIFAVIPPRKAVHHIISVESRLGRGKYSEEHFGFSDFMGQTDVMVEIGSTGTYHQVSCSVSATAEVVSFAKQMIPILEEEVNNEQLVLKRNEVSCRLL